MAEPTTINIHPRTTESRSFRVIDLDFPITRVSRSRKWFSNGSILTRESEADADSRGEGPRNPTNFDRSVNLVCGSMLVQWFRDHEFPAWQGPVAAGDSGEQK